MQYWCDGDGGGDVDCYVDYYQDFYWYFYLVWWFVWYVVQIVWFVVEEGVVYEVQVVGYVEYVGQQCGD